MLAFFLHICEKSSKFAADFEYPVCPRRYIGQSREATLEGGFARLCYKNIKF